MAPIHSISALLEAEEFKGSVWNPACGNGEISQILSNRGYPVLSSDKHNYGYDSAIYGVDFLSSDSFDFLSKESVRNIITKPPYVDAQAFVEKALSFQPEKIAFLMKTHFLEGRERKNLFSRKGLHSVYVLQNSFSWSWFVWKWGYYGKPQINWLENSLELV